MVLSDIKLKFWAALRKAGGRLVLSGLFVSQLGSYCLIQEIALAEDSSLYNPTTISESLIVAGDGGLLHSKAAKLLKAQTSILSDRLSVVFLGDNVYFYGIPPERSIEYVAAKNRLLAQSDIIKQAHVKAVFIPGNHDWEDSGPNGWDTVLRQQELVREQLGQSFYSPLNGCPGPEKTSIGKNFSLYALDSEWWLRGAFKKPKDKESGCTAFTEEMVVEQLKNLIEKDPDAQVQIIGQHHPLETFGSHSREHSPQDLLSKENEHFRKSIKEALLKKRPLLCIAGHDHSLQVIAGDQYCQNYLVSGALSHTSRVYKDERLIFGHDGLGLMRIDFFTDKRVRLLVLGVDEILPQGKVLFEKWLR